MITFEILTQDGRAAFEPGEMIHGLLRWHGDTAPGSIELRLFWHTRGKGSEDAETAEIVRIPGAGKEGEYRFQLRAPDAPHSYEGKLLSILWGIEAVPERGRTSDPLTLVIGPGRRSIRMRPLEKRPTTEPDDEGFGEDDGEGGPSPY